MTEICRKCKQVICATLCRERLSCNALYVYMWWKVKQYKLRVSEGPVLTTVFRIKKEGNDGTSNVQSATVCNFDYFRNIAGGRMFGTCSFVKTTMEWLCLCFKTKEGNHYGVYECVGRQCWQVIGCEGKQRTFGWLSNIQCGGVCDCNSQFSGCLRVKLSWAAE